MKGYYCINFTFKNNKKNEFISSVIKFFNFSTNLELFNDANLSKRTSKAENKMIQFTNFFNEYEIRIKGNHCHIKKFGK